MSDPIERQDAIDAFTDEIPVTGRANAESVKAYVKLVVDRIKQLPSAQPQRWIPCSERLPEKAYGQYWVCTDTGYQCQCRWTDNVYGLGSSGEWTWKIFDIPQYSHVVAWMPLPEPYKERREE